MRRLFACALVHLALAAGSGAAQTATNAGGDKLVVLDHVVAVINGDVLLESDVEEEMSFAALEPFRPNAGRDTRQSSMRRLINRTLILQQMKEQQYSVVISDADVEKSLNELRAHLPQCAKYECATADGWKQFLAADGLSSAEVDAHWRQRLEILRFIDMRFRTGIRIPHESIADYYAKSVVPAFQQHQQKAPPLDELSSRIQEVLLQQQVNVLLQDWLKSLIGEGSVQIVDPAYAQAIDAGSSAVEE